jgi:L-2-hydroxyglutarate oxidase LhgO
MLGGDVSFKTKVMDISPEGNGYRILLDARGESMTIITPNIINAAGLYSDMNTLCVSKYSYIFQVHLQSHTTYV